jgi:hypothetical protein
MLPSPLVSQPVKLLLPLVLIPEVVLLLVPRVLLKMLPKQVTLLLKPHTV